MKGKIFITTTVFLLLTSFTISTYGYCNVPQDTLKKSSTIIKLTPGVNDTAVKSKKSIIIRPSTKDPNKMNDNPQKQFSKEQFSGIPFQAKKTTDPNELKAREYFITGSRKSQEGDYKGAIEDFSKSIDLYKNGNTYMKRGLTYFSIDNYPLALEDLNESVKLLPSNAKAYYIRGVCQYEMRDFRNADADLLKSLELDSTNSGAFNYIAAIKFTEEDYLGALENYSKVIKLDSTNPQAYTNRGMIRHYLKDYKGAEEDYDKAIKWDPTNATAYNNRGAAKLTLQDYPAALLDFDTALELKEDYADAYGNRGRARFNSGDKTGACEDWQKAYSLGLGSAMDLIMKYCK
jgi:tetratricopeptide (TPR) repeat protein